MMVVVTYDINTESADGRRRLTKVAKICENYGQRVQDSVFECVLGNVRLRKLQNELRTIIDLEEDSVRFYFLGKNWKYHVESLGITRSFDIEGLLFF